MPLAAIDRLSFGQFALAVLSGLRSGEREAADKLLVELTRRSADER